MTSSRPYLLRALYEWISDNGMTPHLLVDASAAGVEIPPGVAQDGKVNLNIGMQAVKDLSLDNELIEFNARFSGVARHVQIPPTAVLAIYARENGQGMMFPPEDDQTESAETPSEADDPETDEKRLSKSHLRVIK
ncbi:MAG: ClpXP protease specificity-enhancing factor [Xanthomonadales bacterium]|nr:ClpXP protease specificity-enhancing factor [Xanthomonadales bacterium]